MKIEQLTDFQIDILKEITNIGGGNAATALAQLVNKKIDMEVPTVKLLSYDEVFSNIENEEKQVVAISLRVLGDAPGNFLFILEVPDGLHLVKMLMPEYDLDEFNAMAVSALQEVGNIISSSYVNALTRLVNINLISSVPAFVQDMFGAILTTAYIESGQLEDKLLIIENYFVENNKRIRGQLFFIPNPESLDKIFSLLNI